MKLTAPQQRWCAHTQYVHIPSSDGSIFTICLTSPCAATSCFCGLDLMYLLKLTESSGTQYIMMEALRLQLTTIFIIRFSETKVMLVLYQYLSQNKKYFISSKFSHVRSKWSCSFCRIECAICNMRLMAVCFSLMCAGHQSVQSQVQPQYQHDQEVHRSAHRQAVHRAKPDLGGRVQLRGVDTGAEPHKHWPVWLTHTYINNTTDKFIHLGFRLSLSAVILFGDLKQDWCLRLQKVISSH